MVKIPPGTPGFPDAPGEPPPPAPASLDHPSVTVTGGPADTPHAGGAAPGEVHPEPRGYSPPAGPLGPLIGPDTIRDAVEHCFTTRIGAYLAAVAQSRSHITNPPLAGFHDWINQPGASARTPGQQPRYVVTVPGLAVPPHRKGDGTYAVTYLARVQMWLWGSRWRDVDDRLGAYLVAARTCLTQNPSLGGVARSTTWRGETVNPVTGQGESNHTWGQATLEVTVFVDPVLDVSAGPAPLDPAAPLPAPAPITAVGITVTQAELAADLDDG